MSSQEAFAKPPLAFNPHTQLHPAARHRNIAHIPTSGRENFLLRWYPNEDCWDIVRSTAEAEALIRTKRRHLDILSQLGAVAIPRHYDFVGMSPDGSEIVIYSAVEQVANPQPLTTEKDMRHVANTLNKYFAWVTQTAEPSFLMDLFKAEQYCRTPANTEGSSADSTIMLLDIDAYIVETSQVTLATAREGLREIREQYS